MIIVKNILNGLFPLKILGPNANFGNAPFNSEAPVSALFILIKIGFWSTIGTDGNC